jgi:magnesium transporter
MSVVKDVVQPHSEPLLRGSIDGYLATEVPVFSPEATAAEIRTALLARRFEAVIDIAVCAPREDGALELVGLIPVERCLAAPGDRTARDLMDHDPPVVAPGLNQEHAAWKAAQHGEGSLAVVDDQGRFRGLVPPARLLAVLLAEHDEDLARLGGYLRSTAATRGSLDEALHVRLWHRLPWLVLGLLGSALAALLVDGFEDSLAADVRLAFFIPGIVYMADAVGTQTETLVIRGMAAGVPVRPVFVSEAVTGVVLGTVLALVAGPLAGWLVGSASIGVALALSLTAACAVATIVASALPWAMDRLGRDPAFGSGPLATVAQDLLSLVIYFSIASAVVG